MINLGLPIWLSIVLTLLIGLGIGMYHGLFVTKLKMHGFLITLVTMGLARGCTPGRSPNAFPIHGAGAEQFNHDGTRLCFQRHPHPGVDLRGVAAIAFYVLRYTYIGRQIYAAGGNAEAARFSGVNVDARIILCYVVSVVCAVHRRHDPGRAHEPGPSRRR